MALAWASIIGFDVRVQLRVPQKHINALKNRGRPMWLRNKLMPNIAKYILAVIKLYVFKYDDWSSEYLHLAVQL